MFKIEIFYITNLAIQRYRQCLNSTAGCAKGEHRPGIQDRSVRMIGPVFSLLRDCRGILCPGCLRRCLPGTGMLCGNKKASPENPGMPVCR